MKNDTAFHASTPGLVLAFEGHHDLNERIAAINYPLPFVQWSP